jgi:hypothetical protein
MIHPRQQDAAILGALFAARNQLVTRQELALRAGIAPRSLDPLLAPYIQAGYPIEIHPQGTICLRDPPDIWCAEEILGRCVKAGSMSATAWNPLLLAETASTNDVAREQGRKGAAGALAAHGNRPLTTAFMSRSCCGRSWRPTRPAG